MDAQTTNMKTVYTVVERGNGKSSWCKVGIGFTNRDGSLNLKLDAIPVNGTLQVRDYDQGDRPWEKRPETGNGPRRDADPFAPDPRPRPRGDEASDPMSAMGAR